LALYVVVQVAVPLWVRPHLVPPTTTSMAISRATLDGISLDASGTLTITTHPAHGSWVLSNRTVDAHGHSTALPSWFGRCLPPPPSDPGQVQGESAPQPSGSLQACLARLTSEGYRQLVVYQPKGHFWPLQWAETGLYLGASALLTGLSFWLTRRRLS
jgi:hypothetical protein